MLKKYILRVFYKEKNMKKEDFMNYFKDCKANFEFAGEKILPCPIKRNKKAYYVVVIFQESEERAKEIEENIRKDVNVLKEMLINIEE